MWKTYGCICTDGWTILFCLFWCFTFKSIIFRSVRMFSIRHFNCWNIPNAHLDYLIYRVYNKIFAAEIKTKSPRSDLSSGTIFLHMLFLFKVIWLIKAGALIMVSIVNYLQELPCILVHHLSPSYFVFWNSQILHVLLKIVTICLLVTLYSETVKYYMFY